MVVAILKLFKYAAALKKKKEIFKNYIQIRLNFIAKSSKFFLIK